MLMRAVDGVTVRWILFIRALERRTPIIQDVLLGLLHLKATNQTPYALGSYIPKDRTPYEQELVELNLLNPQDYALLPEFKTLVQTAVQYDPKEKTITLQLSANIQTARELLQNSKSASREKSEGRIVYVTIEDGEQYSVPRKSPSASTYTTTLTASAKDEVPPLFPRKPVKKQ